MRFSFHVQNIFSIQFNFQKIFLFIPSTVWLSHWSMESHTSTHLWTEIQKHSYVPRILMHCTRKKYQTSFCFCLNISHSKSRRKKNCRTSFYSFAVFADADAACVSVLLCACSFVLPFSLGCLIWFCCVLYIQSDICVPFSFSFFFIFLAFFVIKHLHIYLSNNNCMCMCVYVYGRKGGFNKTIQTSSFIQSTGVIDQQLTRSKPMQNFISVLLWEGWRGWVCVSVSGLRHNYFYLLHFSTFFSIKHYAKPFLSSLCCCCNYSVEIWFFVF